VNAGKAIIDGLIGGIGSKVQSLKNKLGEITKLIPDWKGPADVDKKLLFNSGQLIMGGLREGLSDGWTGVRSYLSGLTTAGNFAPMVSVTGVNTGVQQPSSGLENVLRELLETIKGMDPGLKIGTLEVTPETTVGDLWYDAQNSGV
jgi:hypothetical protein